MLGDEPPTTRTDVGVGSAPGAGARPRGDQLVGDRARAASKVQRGSVGSAGPDFVGQLALKASKRFEASTTASADGLTVRGRGRT